MTETAVAKTINILQFLVTHLIEANKYKAVVVQS